jgi:hypothetical protein
MDGYRTTLLGTNGVVLLNTSRSPRREIQNMNQKTSDFQTNLFSGGNSVAAATGRLESGRARGAPLRDFLSSLIVAILVSGCTAAYAPAPLPANHPASPAAPEAPPPPPSQAFRDESIVPAPAEEMPAQGPHAGHSAMHGGHR